MRVIYGFTLFIFFQYLVVRELKKRDNILEPRTINLMIGIVTFMLLFASAMLKENWRITKALTGSSILANTYP